MALMIAEALVPVFFVMFLDYFAGARRAIDSQRVASLNVLVTTFALPPALFVSVAQTSRLLAPSLSPRWLWPFW
jgi:predicted permease